MRRRLIAVPILAFGLVFFNLPVLAELKLGFVNAPRLLDEAPQAQTATDRLKDEFSPREEAMIEVGKSLQKMQERLTRDAAIMNEDERKRLGLDIMARKRELQRSQDAFREDITIRRNDAIARIQDIIKGAITEIGKEQGYDLIFYDGVSFASPALEITDIVLERLRKIHKRTQKSGVK